MNFFKRVVTVSLVLASANVSFAQATSDIDFEDRPGHGGGSGRGPGHGGHIPRPHVPAPRPHVPAPRPHIPAPHRPAPHRPPVTPIRPAPHRPAPIHPGHGHWNRGHHHTRLWGHSGWSSWHSRHEMHPRWSRWSHRWGFFHGRWDGYWRHRHHLVSIRSLFFINTVLWVGYWRSHYHTGWYYYPPYAMEGDRYFVSVEPNYDSVPEVHYMEANVQEFLNLRAQPEINSGNVCGQLPPGAMVPVVSVVRTTESGQPWGMILVNDEVREFLGPQCASSKYVFAAMDYLK